MRCNQKLKNLRIDKQIIKIEVNPADLYRQLTSAGSRSFAFLSVNTTSATTVKYDSCCVLNAPAASMTRRNVLLMSESYLPSSNISITFDGCCFGEPIAENGDRLNSGVAIRSGSKNAILSGDEGETTSSC